MASRPLVFNYDVPPGMATFAPTTAYPSSWLTNKGVILISMDGDVADFDSTAQKNITVTLSELLRTPQSAISLNISAGSVVCQVTIDGPGINGNALAQSLKLKLPVGTSTLAGYNVTDVYDVTASPTPAPTPVPTQPTLAGAVYLTMSGLESEYTPSVLTGIGLPPPHRSRFTPAPSQ